MKPSPSPSPTPRPSGCAGSRYQACTCKRAPGSMPSGARNDESKRNSSTPAHFPHCEAISGRRRSDAIFLEAVTVEIGEASHCRPRPAHVVVAVDPPYLSADRSGQDPCNPVSDRTRDVQLVQAAFGHGAISSTLVYARARAEWVRVAVVG